MRYVGPALIALGLLLLGCAASGVVKHDYCTLTSYFLVSTQDELSRELADALLEHNLLRQELCGKG